VTRTPQEFHKLAEEYADRAANELLLANPVSAWSQPGDIAAAAANAQRASAMADVGALYATLAWSPAEFDDAGTIGGE
jgi:hypothetical protein